MKTVLTIMALVFSQSVFAGNLSLNAEFQKFSGKAFCKKTECKGPQCFYTINFETADYEKIKASGLKSRHFKKSPNDICNAKELPMEGAGSKMIDVILYNVDLKPFADLL